jgi:hypothetical protein
MALDIQALASVFDRYPGVEAVYLFGSHAAGTARPESDIDLALVPRDVSVHEQKLQILADLVRLGMDNVDLVILDLQDLVLTYEAIRYNRIVYKKPDFDRGAMYSYVVRRYLDFRPTLDRQREAYKRRLLYDQE